VVRNLASVEDLSKFISTISFPSQLPPPVFSHEENVTVEDIKEYLEEVILYLGDRWLSFDAILPFFDDYAHKSVTVSLKLRQADEQIAVLEKINHNVIGKVSETESMTLAVYDIIRVLQYRVTELEHLINVKSPSSADSQRGSFIELPSREEVTPDQLHAVLRSITSSQRYSESMRLNHDSYQTEISHRSGLSVRTSVESPVISWPASTGNTNKASYGSSQLGDDVGLEGQVSEFPFSPSTTTTEVSPHFFAGSSNHESGFLSDNAVESVESSAQPTPIATRKQLAQNPQQLDHASRLNLGAIGMAGDSYLPGNISRNDSDNNSNALIKENADGFDSELSALASSLAVAPANGIFQSLGSLWDTNPLVDHEAESASLFKASKFNQSDAMSNISPSSSYSNHDLKSGSFPIHLIPTNDTPSTSDEALEDFITVIRPHEPQLLFRSSAKSFLSKQARRALGARVFEIGLHSLRCFLPDDSLRLSVILWKNHSGHWHTHLSDRLCRLSEQGKIAEDDLIDQNYDDMPSHMEHTLNNVSYASSHVNSTDFRVFCMVDTLPAEISSNGRHDLCLLAFIEEVATIVGKNNLFKRSTILIRAWWVYETTASVGSPIKHYIPDLAMVIMITAIFNKYHDRINYPMQALCFFFLEYSDMDWANAAISLQGIAPFKSEAENQPNLPPLDSGKYLIQASLLDKYWDIVNLAGDSGYAESSADQNSSVADTATVTEKNGDAEDADLTVDAEVDSPSMKTQVVVTQTATALLPGQYNAERIAAGRKAGLESFERRAVNIIHPLTHANMMNEKLNVRRAKRISKAFSTAAKNIHAVLKLASTPGMLSIQTAVKNFFRTAVTRFGPGWRPDVLGNMIWIKSSPTDTDANSQNPWAETWCENSRVSGMHDKVDPEELRDADSELSDYSRDLMKISLDRLWDDILYSSLVLEGKITETALLILTKEILLERGTLPVGEIGKMLQELTALNSLSSKLKEKFGGLKKFLERFSDHFVIGTDHPFNPHVYLRQNLTAEDFEIINRGTVPPQLLAKFKKVGCCGLLSICLARLSYPRGNVPDGRGTQEESQSSTTIYE
jgi:hypothetical protein